MEEQIIRVLRQIEVLRGQGMSKADCNALELQSLNPRKIPVMFQEGGSMGRPDFIGIGAQKAATTWLFQCLKMHPDVYFPRGKEIHFWDRRDQNNRPIEEYEDIFSSQQIDHIGGKLGDITPAYMLISDDRIAEIKQLAPDVRLILVARNPVERAISAVLQVLRGQGVDPIQCESKHIDSLLFSNYITECGLYGKHLQRWLRVFSTEQVHVMLNDDIGADPRGTMKQIARHVGVEPDVYDMIDERLLRRRVSPTREKLSIPDSTRMKLLQKYRLDIETLESLIGRRSDWGKGERLASTTLDSR